MESSGLTSGNTRRRKSRQMGARDDGWSRYQAEIREAVIYGEAFDRSSTKVGDHVRRPFDWAQVTRSADCFPRALNTWGLEYADGRFSLAPHVPYVPSDGLVRAPYYSLVPR